MFIPYDLDRVCIGALGGNVYEIFDPPYWRIFRWCWWLYMTRYYLRVELFRRRIRTIWVLVSGRKTHFYDAEFQQIDTIPKFDFGTVDFKVGNATKRVRVWKTRRAILYVEER